MRTIGFVVAMTVVPGMFGQAPNDAAAETRFLIKHAETVQEFHEMSDVIRQIAGIRVVSSDNVQMSLTVRGTAEQLGAAEWLRRQLDQPVSSVGEGAAEYKVTGMSGGRLVDEVVRIICIRHAATIQDFVELAGAVQTIAQILRVSTYLAPRVMIVRGTPDDLRLAEWLISELDQPANQPRANKSEYVGGPDDVTALYRLMNTQSAADVNDVAGGLSRAQRNLFAYKVWAYKPDRAIVVRSHVRPQERISAADQIAMADWLVKQLDQSPGQTERNSEDYSVPKTFDGLPNRRSPDEFLRVYYFTARETMWQFRKDAEQAIGKGRVQTIDMPRAAVVCGDPEALSKADQIKQQIGMAAIPSQRP